MLHVVSVLDFGHKLKIKIKKIIRAFSVVLNEMQSLNEDFNKITIDVIFFCRKNLNSSLLKSIR